MAEKKEFPNFEEKKKFFLFFFQFFYFIFHSNPDREPQSQPG